MSNGVLSFLLGHENETLTLTANCGGLWAKEAYCVHVPGASLSATPTTTITIAQPSATAVQPPGPTQDGIATACDNYATPATGDGCYSFAERYSISLDQLCE